MSQWGLALVAAGAAGAWASLLWAVLRDGSKTRERLAVVEQRVSDQNQMVIGLGTRLDGHERMPHPLRNR